uniref:Uncharacterized protein n=1 Tax=Arundo donax TaxID=35708 RepID=A0A0A9ARF3_ARUDO
MEGKRESRISAICSGLIWIQNVLL